MATIVYIFPNFQNCARCENDLKNNKHNSLHLGRNMLGYLSLDILYSSWLTVKTVRFSEQIMSAEKYPSIFSRQMATIVYIFPNSENCACYEKVLKDNKDYSLHLTEGLKMLPEAAPYGPTLSRKITCLFFPAVNWFCRRLQMGLFTQLCH